MQGTIIQINVSQGGLPKRPIAQARIGAIGLEGDAQAHPQIHGGPRKAVLLIANRSELTQFINVPRVKVVPSTAATADLYALVYAALRRKGHPIPTNDQIGRAHV